MKRIPGNASCSSACPQAGTESSIRLSLFVLSLLFFSRWRKSINGKARFVTGNAYCLLSNNNFSYGKEENKEIKLI